VGGEVLVPPIPFNFLVGDYELELNELCAINPEIAKKKIRLLRVPINRRARIREDYPLPKRIIWWLCDFASRLSSSPSTCRTSNTRGKALPCQSTYTGWLRSSNEVSEYKALVRGAEKARFVSSLRHVSQP
jgi:hypothetical protein